MARLEIRIYDDPILHEKARRIERITQSHKDLAADMIETMYESRGIGLAANQVGVLERIITVDTNWADRDGRKGQGPQPTAMINPEVLEEGTTDEACYEGCLSLPELEGEVWRPTWIRYRYLDLEGRAIELEASDLQARCIQHEIDHLDGILFIDRMAPEKRKNLAGKLAKLRKTRLSRIG
jgi:peptide deformylase